MSALAMSMALVGCVKEDPQSESASMTISPETLNFEARGALSKTVEVKSNRDWKINDVPEWALVTIDGQNIDDRVVTASASPVTVTVTVLENDGMERSAAVVFNGGTSARKTLSVNQVGNASYTTIADVRAMNLDPNAKVVAEDGTIIKGRVISNSDLNNLNSVKTFHIQDATGGACVYCQGDHNLSFGDEVVIDISGSTLEYYNMLFEVNNLDTKKINVLSKGGGVEPLKVSAKDFKNNRYESRYIEIDEDVQVSEGSLSKTWVMGGSHTSIDMIARDGTTFVVRSSKYSSFGSETVAQGCGKIRGIATIYNEGMQLIFAQASDWTGLTNDRFTIETPKVESEKISVLLEASAGAEITLRNATVVATSDTDLKDPAPTFLLTDAYGDYLLVYHADTAPKVGDVVTVKGNLSSYGTPAMPQVSDPSVTILSSGSAVVHPAAEDITEGFDGFSSDDVKLVTIVGTYTSNEQYQEINIEGASKTCSFLKPDVIDVAPFENVPNTRFTGYYLYTNKMYPYIMLVSVEAGEGDYLVVNPASQDVAASETRAQLSVLSNADWTCESKTEGFTVDVASGSGDATVTVSFSENKDTQNSRTAEIEFRSGSIVKTATITQKFAQSASTVVLTFPDENSENNKISAYDKSWTAVTGSVSFNIANFNNNSWKNDWTYIKCGSKNYASVATITDVDPLAAVISKVVVTVDKLTASKVNGTKLEVSPKKDFSSDVQTVDLTIGQGDMEYVVPSPAANLYYRLTFDCAQGSSNGLIQISKVTYIAQ